MDRRFGFRRSRAAVCSYLKKHFPLRVKGNRPGPKPRRRWQRDRAGELWQHDATPVHIWPSQRPQALIVTVDDCTRTIILASIFERETLWSHFLHLRKAFELYGLPEILYTDGFTMFGHEGDDVVTRCGRMLRAVGVGHRIAPTPQAKGKIERSIETFQRRLVTLLISAKILGEECCAAIVDDHITYWNAHHVNRTTNMTPDVATTIATAAGRNSYGLCPGQSLLNLHMAVHETRRVSSANTIDFNGRIWPMTPTLKKRVWLIIHPGQQFWVVESKPDPLNPAWPTILAKHNL